MASPVDPHALNERLLALFNHTNSDYDASISRSRRSLVSDSTLSSTEVDPDTFFHRSLFDIGDGEPLGGLGPVKDMDPVVDTHLEEWTKSMADYWVRKRENDRKAALAEVEGERSNGQPFTGNLFEPQTPPSKPPPNTQMYGEKDLEFESGNVEIVSTFEQDSATAVRLTEECYEKIPITYKEDKSGSGGGGRNGTGRVGSARQSSNRQGNTSQTRSRRQPQTRSTKNNTRSKPALSQASNSVLNGRVQKPRRSSNSASAKPTTSSTTSPLRRSARIQEMKAKTQKPEPTTSSPSRGQSKSTKRTQKRQPFRNSSKPQSKPQGISKPRTRGTRKTRNSKG